jgi:PEP-CTERM motif
MSYIAMLSVLALGILVGSAGAAVAGLIAVPEPSTLALLGAGLGAAAILRFWKAR